MAKHDGSKQRAYSDDLFIQQSELDTARLVQPTGAELLEKLTETDTVWLFAWSLVLI